MIVFFKNFQRTERTLLSIQSVRHLFPDIKVRCLHLFLEEEAEYSSYLDKFQQLGVDVFFSKKTYNFESDGAGIINNGYYFTEGINKMFNLCEDGEKVLMLDEDSFFTSGETIRFLLDETFDFAYGIWPSPHPNGHEQINGSIICVDIKSTRSIFPIIEQAEYIENLLGRELWHKCILQGLKTIRIPTRDYTNYGGDGLHTNDIEVIKRELTIANIPYHD